MNYYFCVDKKRKCYIVVAKSEENAKKWIKDLAYLYKLELDTFDQEGILMSCR